MKWKSTLWCVVMLIWPGKIVESETPFTGMNTLIREYIGRTTTEKFSTFTTLDDVSTAYPEISTPSHQIVQNTSEESGKEDMHSTVQYKARLSTNRTMMSEEPLVGNVQHAALPSGVQVLPLPLENSANELTLNVTWDPPIGPEVREYSLEVHSQTNTIDCQSNLCYESNIPGDSLWSVIPTFASPLAVGGCSIRPGCAYRVKLIAHPWDGHTAANLFIELDECVTGVCSCAHAPRLPLPLVSAKIISVEGELFVNVSWSLPESPEPLRLPPRLKKQFYHVSIGKQMVSDAHPSPWFDRVVERYFDAFGFVVVPEHVQWRLLPITERNMARSGERNRELNYDDGPTRHIVLDVKLLARVRLIDERGCYGREGNATAYDPSVDPSSTVGTFALWAVFGGACVLAMVAILAFSASAVKRVLSEFRSVPDAAPLQPLRPRPNWFPIDASV